MKDEIMQRVSAVIAALNNISVCGKQNLANLSGCIAILEETVSILDGYEFAPPDNGGENI